MVIWCFCFSDLNWRWKPPIHSLWQKSAEQWFSPYSSKGREPKKFDMSLMLSAKSSFYLTVKNWVAWCKTEHFSTEGKDCPNKATCGHYTRKCCCHSQHDCGRLENFSQKDSRDSGDRFRNMKDSSCVGQEKALFQMGAKMFERGSEPWSCCRAKGNSWTLYMEHSRFLSWTCDNGQNMDIRVWPRDKRTI